MDSISLPTHQADILADVSAQSSVSNRKRRDDIATRAPQASCLVFVRPRCAVKDVFAARHQLVLHLWSLPCIIAGILSIRHSVYDFCETLRARDACLV